MILRRLPVLAVAVAGIGGLVAGTRSAAEPATALFSIRAAPWMPAVPADDVLTSSWFCPGVPAAGAEGTGGEVVIANPGDAELRARVAIVGGPGEEVARAVTVEPFGRVSIDIDEEIDAGYASAVVEIDGGGGLVEQRAVHPAGTSVAPCANAASPAWYLAEGFTAEDSVEQLVLTNPYDWAATVDIGFATAEGSRQPPELEGFPVPARSVKVVDMADIAARDETEVAVNVVATRGSLVVGRAQIFDGGGRLGYSVALASPALRDQWWFANGLTGADVQERYSIYNPTEDDVEVIPIVLGITTSEFIPIEPIAVQARQVTTFVPAEVDGMPDGRHAMVFSTGDGTQSVVVEQALTRTIEGRATSSVLLGAPARLGDGYVARQWQVAIGADEPTTEGIVVFNIDNSDATVTVEAVGADGPEPVAALTDLRLRAGGLLTVDLTDPAVVGRPVVITSTSRVFVQRLLPREEGAQGRTGSWAVPVAE